MTKYNPLLSPLDYASKLAERYKRQDAQLERYHQQLRQRDQQEYDAKTAVTPVKVLSQLADTVNKVSSTAITFDQLKAKKVKQNLTSYGLTAQDFLDLRSGEKDLDNDFADLKLIVDEVVPINHAKKVLKLNQVNIRLPKNSSKDLMNDIVELAKQNKGDHSFIVHIPSENNQERKIISKKIKVSSNNQFLILLRDLLGESNVWID